MKARRRSTLSRAAQTSQPARATAQCSNKNGCYHLPVVQLYLGRSPTVGEVNFQSGLHLVEHCTALDSITRYLERTASWLSVYSPREFHCKQASTALHPRCCGISFNEYSASLLIQKPYLSAKVVTALLQGRLWVHMSLRRWTSGLDTSKHGKTLFSTEYSCTLSCISASLRSAFTLR